MVLARAVVVGRLLAALGLGGLATAPVGAFGTDPLGLAWVETPDLRLVYPSPELDALAPHTVRTFTASLQWQRARFGWTPSGKTVVQLKDFSDQSNANATPIPVNRLRIEVSPASNAFETNPSGERMATLMNHELVHVAHGDVANADDRFWRGLFGGKVYAEPDNPLSLGYAWLTTPRYNVPRWLLEGAAVFMETWMAGGIGRAQGGYDEMVFRGMVRDGTPFYDPLGLASRGVRVDFQVGANAYLYGTRFFTWLAWEHTPERVAAWLRREDGSARHYAAAFEETFGLPLADAWRRWVAFEQDFQRANLASVRRQPITPMAALTARAVGSSSRTFLDPGGQVLYGAFRQSGIVEHIGALHLASGRIDRLADITGGALYSVTSLAHDPEGRRLFYTERNYGRRDLKVLDLATGKSTLLLKNGRIGELAFNRADGSLWGVRHESGRATLVRLPPPFDGWQELHTFPYGVVASELDISPDGQRLAATVSEPQGEQFLRVWPLAALRQGRLEAPLEVGFGLAAPEGFVFSPDGRWLYGTSYYTGVSNVYRVDATNGRVTAVSNAEIGLFRPLPLADGRLMVLAFTGEGLLPSAIDPQPVQQLGAIRFLGSDLVARHPVLKEWQVASPRTVDDTALVQARGIYRPLEQMGLQSGYPVLQAYKSRTALGWRLNAGDWLGFADADLTLALSPSDTLPAEERLHAEARARYLGWRGVLAWNRADFFDFFGPTRRARKGWQVGLGYDEPLIVDTPRRLDLRVDFARYGRLDTLPGAQNAAAAGSALTTAEFGLKYRHLRRSLGAVDDERGVAADALLALRRGDRYAPQLQGGVDLGFALPLPHLSLWSRTAAGVSGGPRDDSLSAFYFGAFGNNRVDNGTVQRYREPGSMPGFSIDAIAARSFVRQQAELLLPPVVFESAGVPDLFVNWLRPQLFATALWADPGRPERARYGSVGAQVDLRLGVLHWYEMFLSAGYGAGFTGSRRSGGEWMLSLKIQ